MIRNAATSSFLVVVVVYCWMIVSCLGQIEVSRAATASVGINDQQHSGAALLRGRVLQQQQQSGDDQQERPVMYTFFDSLPTTQSGFSAGMSNTAHDTMIQVWQQSWEQAGWRTQLLTMDHAKQHPEFTVFDEKIKNFTMSDYDKLCYYRWIAMAAVGGGWMSDYDTLPLHNFTNEGIDLPMHGSFTVYQAHVPSLLSGSSNEWLRLIKRLVEYAYKHKMDNGETPSDMFTLMELQKRYPDMMIHRDDVAGVYAIPDKDQWTTKLCQELTPRHMRAMHFSHFFVGEFWLPNHPDDTLQDRPQIAKKWLTNWLNNCGRKQFRQW